LKPDRSGHRPFQFGQGTSHVRQSQWAHPLLPRTWEGRRLMFMNITCPSCGQKHRVPERMIGQQVRCPACSTLFQCGSVSPPSAKRPIPADPPLAPQAAPQVRAAQAETDQSIHYGCPRCSKPLESPAHMAGQKVNCPDCGQRLQIPQPPGPPPSIPVRVVAPPPPPAPPAPAKEELILTVVAVPEPAPAPREYCLECGVNITKRPRVQTCPDCGSLFCSAMCYREHRYHAHPSSR
jgi:predicted Zn finger-like uncharacterized protein